MRVRATALSQLHSCVGRSLPNVVVARVELTGDDGNRITGTVAIDRQLNLLGADPAAPKLHSLLAD